jgi:putative phosphoesterase
LRLLAALYDIHGNLPALDAVLEDVRKAGADEILIGGDVVPGPMPRETLLRLMTLTAPVRFIDGNCDREVRSQFAGADSSPMPETVKQNFRWVCEQLRQEDIAAMATWPKTLSLEVGRLGKVLFCHATPRNDIDIFTRLTPEEPLLPIFDGVHEALVVCGHTHMQFDRMIGRVRVVNAGSVGMPFGKPGADWLLLGEHVELRHTDYDLSAAADLIRGTSYPQAEDFASKNILSPPSEKSMLEAFSKAEL